MKRLSRWSIWSWKFDDWSIWYCKTILSPPSFLHACSIALLSMIWIEGNVAAWCTRLSGSLLIFAIGIIEVCLGIDFYWKSNVCKFKLLIAYTCEISNEIIKYLITEDIEIITFIEWHWWFGIIWQTCKMIFVVFAY